MRTKALICAALVAASAISAMAQVYSLNIVGYVNKSVPVGYSMLANPLKAGVTNGANEIMPIILDEQFLTWNGAGFNVVQYSSIFNDWIDPATLASAKPPALPPGTAFFYYTPVATNLTFVGEVVPAPSTTNSLALPIGYSMIGSPMPVSLTDITSGTGSMPLVADMQVLNWNGAGFTTKQYSSIFNAWINPVDLSTVPAPALNIAEGFFYYTPVATNWSQSLP